MEEAANARTAIATWIAEATAAGWPVPPPSDHLGAVTRQAVDPGRHRRR